MSTLLERRLPARFSGAGGGKDGGEGGGGAREAANDLQSSSIVRVIDVVAEGEVKGLVNGAQSIFFNETPLAASDGSLNFQGVSWEMRNGLPDQEALASFTDQEGEVSVGTELKYGRPISRTITSENLDAIDVTITIQSLTSQDTSNGNLNGYTVAWRIDIQSGTQPFVVAHDVSITGKTTSATQKQYRIDLAAIGSAPWTVRVTRLSGDDAAANVNSRTFWASYTEIVEAKLIYPDTALLGLAVDAQSFGSSVPARGYDLDGLIVDVPANYDPVARSYSGLWDHTWKRAWSNNPAWCLLAMLTNPRWGLGQYVSLDQIETDRLYEIAQYCDERVEDGFGGTEPRFTFNACITAREDAYKVLQSMAQSFRGMICYSGGIFYPTIDMPGEPVVLVGPANVVDGTFEYSGSDLNARHTAALVTWTNPNDGYKTDIEVVEDEALINRWGYNPIEVTAFGCTSRGQARRFGKWIIDTEWHETDTVTYRASFDHMFQQNKGVRPGDLILIADPSYMAYRAAGRIIEANSTAITLDAPITIATGETYTLYITLPDGQLADLNPTNPPGEWMTLSVPALDPPPNPGAIWMISGSDVAPRTFRVIGVAADGPELVRVTALQHDPTKYVRVEQGIRFDPPRYTTLPTGPIAPPSNASYVEVLYRTGVAVAAKVVFSWSPSLDARMVHYQVEARAPGLNWFPAGTTPNLSIDVPETSDGIWGFRVRAVDIVGRVSSWAQIGPVTLLGLMAPPGDVTGLHLNVVGALATLSWNAVTDLDLDHYELRWSGDAITATWNASSLLGTVGAGTTNAVYAARNGTYFVKAVDSSGVYSINPCEAFTNLAALVAYNVVSTVLESPEFAGAIDHVVKSGASIKLDSIGTVDATSGEIDDGAGLWDSGRGYAASGVYEFAHIADLGGVFDVQIRPDIAWVAEDGAILFDSTTGPFDDAAGLFDGSSVNFANVRLQISLSQETGQRWDDGAGLVDARPGLVDGDWSDWHDLTVSAIRMKSARFRVMLESTLPTVTPVVDHLGVILDMPDRIESGINIVSGTAPYSVLFDPPFLSEPAIGITGQNLSSGDVSSVTTKSRAGFTVAFFDASHVPVSRTFDYLARGSGGEIF